MKFTSVSKNCKKEWYILRTFAVLIFAVITAAIAASDFQEYSVLKVLLLIPIVMLDIFILIYAYIFPSLQYARYKYKISDDRIEMQFGVIFLRHQIVPFSRLQHIVVYRGVLDRLFNMSTVTVFTAGSFVRLRNLGVEQALAVTEHLKTILKQKDDSGEAVND